MHNLEWKELFFRDTYILWTAEGVYGRRRPLVRLGKEETGRAQGCSVKKTHEEKGQGCQLKEEKGRRRGKYNQTAKLVWFNSSVRRFFKIRVGYIWVLGCVLSGR